MGCLLPEIVQKNQKLRVAWIRFPVLSIGNRSMKIGREYGIKLRILCEVLNNRCYLLNYGVKLFLWFSLFFILNMCCS